MENEELDVIEVMELVKLLGAYCKRNNIVEMTCGGVRIYYSEPPKKGNG